MPVRALLLAALFAGAPLAAQDLQRQLDRGSTGERSAALRELAKRDPSAATERAATWLAPGQDPALRRAAARTLWDLGAQAKAAEPALRAQLDDRDDDLAYNCVGALAAMDVPKAELRPARLRLARSNDGFIALYAARALHPDPALPVADVLDAVLAAINLTASGRPADIKTRDTLRTNARTLGFAVAEKSGREGFAVLLAAYPKASPPGRELLAEALGRVPPQHGDPAAVGALLDDASKAVRRSAMWAVARYGERAAGQVDPMLRGLAPQHDKDERETAASALAHLGEAPALATEQAVASAWRRDVETRIAPALAATATSDADRDVRKAAADGLQKLRLWGGPALGTIGERIAREPDAVVRHALVRACWTARESSRLPRDALAAIARDDPVDYVRNEARVILEYQPAR